MRRRLNGIAMVLGASLLVVIATQPNAIGTAGDESATPTSPPEATVPAVPESGIEVVFDEGQFPQAILEQSSEDSSFRRRALKLVRKWAATDQPVTTTTGPTGDATTTVVSPKQADQLLVELSDTPSEDISASDTGTELDPWSFPVKGSAQLGPSGNKLLYWKSQYAKSRAVCSNSCTTTHTVRTWITDNPGAVTSRFNWTRATSFSSDGSRFFTDAHWQVWVLCGYGDCAVRDSGSVFSGTMEMFISGYPRRNSTSIGFGHTLWVRDIRGDYHSSSGRTTLGKCEARSSGNQCWWPS